VTDFESSSMRVSDADRESAMTALGEHMSTGRLTLDEYGDRAAQVSTAKTRQELFAQFSDLPQPWPKLSGETPPVVTPEPLPRTAAPVPRPRVGLGLAVAGSIPVTWVAAVLVTIITGYWAVFLIPVLLTVLGAVLLGRGVHRLGRRVAGNFSQATGFTGFNGDWVRRDDRDDARSARYTQRSAWQAEMLGQLNAQIQRGMERGMRGGYGRGGRYRGHHGRRHH
jgi:hypothetical protein